MKEPIRNGKLWLVFGLLFFLSVPWYLPVGSFEPVILGFPYWVIIVLLGSAAISLFLTYVLKYEWDMEGDGEKEERL